MGEPRSFALCAVDRGGFPVRVVRYGAGRAASRRRVADRFRDDRNRSGRPGPVGYRCAGTAAAGGEASRQQVEYGTSEREEIAVQTPQPEKKPRERETPGQTPQRSDAQQPAEQPRTVNRRALFPGRTAGSTSTSEGPAAGEGNAGDLSGAPEGSHDGTGQSDSGIAYDLSGRSVVGKLPKPSYPGNESGKVVVDVTVDASGRVTYASYRAQGSTTNSKRLVDAAVEAARKARFSSSESLMQTGTITYVFTLE